jgi:carbon-monoxide dehydrogenase small subunit
VKTEKVKFSVNSNEYAMSVGNMFGQIKPNETLVDTLRNRLGLTGAKTACKQGACGCCTVIIDGDAVPSCQILTVDCEGKAITTIEGLAAPDGTLDPIQQAFLEYYAYQCGFCTAGIIMTARALLNKNPNPTHEEIGEALSGNYCRCISHYHVFDAIESLTQKGA